MPEDEVDNKELLYRAVRAIGEGPPQYHIEPNGKVRISASAFADKEREVSVDRAKLRNHNPSLSRKSETDGVLGLYADAIRKVVFTHAEQPYRVNVRPDPIPADNPLGLPENLAHALIYCEPPCGDKPFNRKLIVQLARLATELEDSAWMIKPADLRKGSAEQ